MDKRKLAVAYIFLVGVPLLALVGILRAGNHLIAPPALHGNWSVQVDFRPWQSVPCGALLNNTQQPLLSIDQSGRDLTVSLNDGEKTVIPGTIDGFTLSSTPSGGGVESDPGPRPNPACQSSQSLRLQAIVNQHEKQRSLTGTFQLEGCMSCSPIAFSATRETPKGRKIE
jgi:hypothetical protein